MKKMKKWLALALALCMAVPNVSGLASNDVSAVYAAEETTKTWEDWAASLSEDAAMAVKLTGDEQKFDGTRVLDLSSEYADVLKNVSEGSVIMRFKADSLASHGVILGTSNSAATLSSDVSAKDANKTSMVITTKDQFYLVYSYDRAGIAGPYSFADGDWHTVIISAYSNGKSMRFTFDGKEVFSLSNRSDLLGMFSKQTNLDTVTIGGHKNGNSIVGGFNGSISDVIVTTEVISDADAIALSAAGHTTTPRMGSEIAATMLDTSLRDNTWLFTGGEAVQGGFDQTRGIRNYIGQFEEYIRWRKIDGSAVYARQRYTFNTAAAGQTLAEIVENFDAKVGTFKTKATVYMVGAEDYAQGTAHVDEYKASLKSFIDKSLALKDNGAFVIVQKPFATNDAAANTNIEAYCAAVDEVFAEYASDMEKYSRMLVVDHYANTKNNADFKANKLTNNKLNAQGHLAISQQFAEAAVNYAGSGYPHSSVVLNRVELDMPEEYLSVQPAATAGADSLAVEIPAVDGVNSWKYELTMDETIVSGTADKNTFEITGLVAGTDYVLKIQSADGEKQLVTTKGTITEGNKAVKDAQDELDANQQKIVDMVAGEEPMTWLFMGDSITHASGLTYGYDGIAQAFEEFVKEGLGRTDDIVLNTAVANANTVTTIQELDQRLTNYNPDVISLMIGTNDCSSREAAITLDVFRNNMKTILDTMKTNYPDAVILLRSMVPFFNDGNREPNRQSYMNVVEEMAEEYGAIYVDQYTSLAEATSTYTWLPGKMFTDNLHPEANGHRVMTNMFIKACGLWTEDTPMTNLFYSMDIVEESNNTTPAVTSTANQIRVSVTDLKSKSGLSLGDVVLKATSKENGQTYETSVKAGKSQVTLSNLPEETTYTVEVSAHLTNTAKKVTFKTVDVTLAENTKPIDPSVPPTIEVDEDLLKAGSIGVSEENMTEEQPIAAGTADSSLFRIPALITLDNGDLLAAADARWTTSADWGGLDTIASVSSDNGKTWYYSFPIYFPDSNTTYPGMEVATTAIDPVIVQGNDGTIYCIADMNPSGITTGDIMPGYGTGYVQLDGEWRLALTDTYTKPNENNTASYGDPADYEYYVGDFDEDGFAHVLNMSDDSETEWIVDEWYNIYKLDEAENTYKPLTQTMVNDTTVIQQNAFYKDSELHVFNTGYLWMVTSTDNGRTWGNPTILNTQIKRSTDRALLASPGQGMVASNGDIIIPFYDHGDGQENASIIWSSDNGKTWTRSNDVSGMWSSESEMVEVNNGVLRLFYRNGMGTICYADFTKTGDTWTAGAGVNTGIAVCSTCNVTAIRHSETIDGKVVVMVACPGGSGRNNGKIFTFLVDEDNSMELYATYSVNEGAYAYSCMTEMANKNIGLLWENAGAAIRFDEIELDVVLGYEKNVVIDAGEVYTEEMASDKAAVVTETTDPAIAELNVEYVVEEAKIALYDHVGNTDSSLASFSSEVNASLNLEKAELVLTSTGDDTYTAYNEASGKYAHKSGAAYWEMSAAADTTDKQLKFTATTAEDGTVTYRICRASDSARYAIFYFTNMDFNTNGGYNASWTAGSYELVLLEKQETKSDADVIPGYTRATEITSGKTYLITYIWTDGSVIVLYPGEASTGGQAKLVGDEVTVAKNVITITGIAPGETSAVIDGVLYDITILDPALSPSYDGNDYPVEKLTATAGHAQNGTTEGPAALALDGNPATHFHSSWQPQAAEEDLWIQVELEEASLVTGLRYLPRANAGNGTVSEYQVLYSMDGENWTEAAAGKWAVETGWKKATFDEPVMAKFVRLFAVDSTADSNGRHMSAAEIRVTVTTEAEVKKEVCEIYPDVEHGQWYEEFVQFVHDNDIMTGNKDTGMFNPNGNLLRQQFVMLLWNMEGKPVVEESEAFDVLVDADENGYYADALRWAYNEGIMTGVNGKYFQGDQPLKRQQLAKMLYEYAEKKGYDVSARADYSSMENADQVADYAKEYMAWAVGTGMITGKNGTDLAPMDTATRAAVAKIVKVFCDTYAE